MFIVRIKTLGEEDRSATAYIDWVMRCRSLSKDLREHCDEVITECATGKVYCADIDDELKTMLVLKYAGIEINESGKKRTDIKTFADLVAEQLMRQD